MFSLLEQREIQIKEASNHFSLTFISTSTHPKKKISVCLTMLSEKPSLCNYPPWQISLPVWCYKGLCLFIWWKELINLLLVHLNNIFQKPIYNKINTRATILSVTVSIVYLFPIFFQTILDKCVVTPFGGTYSPGHPFLEIMLPKIEEEDPLSPCWPISKINPAQCTWQF